MDNNNDNFTRINNFLKHHIEERRIEQRLLKNYLSSFHVQEDLADQIISELQDRFGSVKSAIENGGIAYHKFENSKANLLISLITAIINRVRCMEPIFKLTNFKCLEDCAHHAIRMLGTQPDETFFVMFVGNNFKVYNEFMVSNSSSFTVDVSISAIIRQMPSLCNYSIIIAHNHNHYSTSASLNDQAFNNKILEVCNHANIVLVDHIIVHKNVGHGLFSHRDYIV